MNELSVNDVPESITVEFQLTKAEFVASLRGQRLRSRRLQLASGLAVALIGFGLVLMILPKGQPVIGLIFGGIAVYRLLVIAWRIFGLPFQEWKRVSSLSGPVRYEFSDGGIQLQTARSSAVHAWTLFPQTFERGDLYFLQIGKSRSGLVVPKRSFLTASDESRFRALVAAHTEALLEAPSPSLPA